MFVLFGCSKSDSGPDPDDGRAAVLFDLTGIGTQVVPAGEVATGGSAGSAAATRAGAAEPLDEGVTVRVVAYRRTGTNADIANDRYVADKTYVAVKENDAIVLKACTIADDGTVTEDASACMLLRVGTYDFYAIAPALKLDANHQKMDVNHGVDYAASLTENVAVATQPGGAAQPVSLTTLDRKCARLHFSISRSHQNVLKAVFNSVKLDKIALAPASPLLGAAIAAGANTGSYEFPAGTFAELNEASEFLSSGAGEVLPKSKAPFELAMNVSFNDAVAKDLKAEIPALSFVPGYQYCFGLHLKGNMLELTLQVTDWNDDPKWDTGVGSPGASFIVSVGSWTVSGWETSVGGQFTPIIAPDSWTPSAWDTDIDGFFAPIIGPGSWTDEGWSTDVDDRFAPIVGPDGWTDQSGWSSDNVGQNQSS